eukprot:4975188-Pyramimonas_sp.AAC.1
MALAAGKGRGRKPVLRRPLRRVAALALAATSRCYVRWLASELNAADRPSRHGFFHGKSFEGATATPPVAAGGEAAVHDDPGRPWGGPPSPCAVGGGRDQLLGD